MSIRQAKIALHLVQRADALVTLAHTLRGCGRQVTVFQVFEPLCHQLAQVVGLGEAGLCRQTVQSLLGRGIESD